MKTLLFVVDENRRGGVSVVMRDILLSLNPKKFEIELLVLHDQREMLKDLPDHIRVLYGTPFFDTIDYTFSQILKTKNIRLFLKKMRIILGLKTGLIQHFIVRERKKILNGRRYDVEIAAKDGFPAVFTAFGDSKRKVHWLHSEYKVSNSNSKYLTLFQKVMTEFDCFIAVSENVKRQFESIYHTENKTTVVRNLVIADHVQMLGNDNPLDYEQNKINVVLVGRCHSDKGYDRMLRVLNMMHGNDKINEIVFHIVGDGPQRAELESYVQANGLDTCVKFYGMVENPYRYMKNADCLFLPSINESFGLVAVEAQILGVPVVATKTAATESIIDSGISGMVVANSEEGVRSGIQVMSDKQMISEFRKRLENYDYDNTVSIRKIHEILER